MADRAALRDVLDQLENLDRRERRLVVFGNFKTGKSSLINRLIGTSVLPERAVGFSPAVETVPLDPRSGWIAVDTPGLFQDPAATERVLAEIGRADLAVMVLSADQILSGAEREMARQVNEMLRGNLIFVVNRIDMIDEGERDEVLTWARAALEGMGNELVGRPRLFAVSAAPDHGDLGWFVPWLLGLLGSDRLPLLSRLACLHSALSLSRQALAGEITQERRQVAQAEAEEAGRIEEYRAQMRSQLATGRTRLRGPASDLRTHDDAFLASAREEAHRILRAGGGAVPWGVLVKRYGAAVSDDVRDMAADLPVTLPPFDLTTWIIRPDQIAVTHPAAHTGSTLGQMVGQALGDERVAEGGATLGRWVARNVFQTDVEADLLRRVEATGRRLLDALHLETAQYFDRLDALLQEADAYYAGWTRRQPRLDELRQRMHDMSAIEEWTDDLTRRVDDVMREVEHA